MSEAAPPPVKGGGFGRAIDAAHSVSRRIARVVEAIAAAIVLVVAVLVVVQILARAVGAGFFWIEEVARLGLVSLTFLGAAFVAARGKHLRVDAIVARFSERAQRVLRAVAELLMIVVCAVLSVAATEIVLDLIGISTSSSGMSRGVLYLPAAIGFGLMAFAGLCNLALLLVSPGTLEERESGMESVS